MKILRIVSSNLLWIVVTIVMLAACAGIDDPTASTAQEDTMNTPISEESSAGEEESTEPPDWCTVENGYASDDSSEKRLPTPLSHGDLVWQTLLHELKTQYGGSQIEASPGVDPTLTILVIDDFETIPESKELFVYLGNADNAADQAAQQDRIVRIVPIDIEYGLPGTVEDAVYKLEEEIFRNWQSDEKYNRYIVNMSWVLLPCKKEFLEQKKTVREYLDDGILSDIFDNNLEALLDAFVVRNKNTPSEIRSYWEEATKPKFTEFATITEDGDKGEYTLLATNLTLLSRYADSPPVVVGVAAAGNVEKTYPLLPALSKAVISVAGDSNGERANYSNSGGILMPDTPCVKASATSTMTTSTRSTIQFHPSDSCGEGYLQVFVNDQPVRGTSFAAPRITAAMTHYLMRNPHFPSDCKEELLDNGEDFTREATSSDSSFWQNRSLSDSAIVDVCALIGQSPQ